MSFLAKLNIDDKEYNLLSISFGVSSNYDPRSLMISGAPQMSTIDIDVESTSSGGFFKWSLDLVDKKDGKIVFFKRDAMAGSRTLEFKQATLMSYSERFNSIDSNAMVTSLKLVVEEIIFEDGVYKNPAVLARIKSF